VRLLLLLPWLQHPLPVMCMVVVVVLMVLLPQALYSSSSCCSSSTLVRPIPTVHLALPEDHHVK
jgi:hypothetical protein